MDEQDRSRKIQLLALIGAGLLLTATVPASADTSSLSGGIDNRYSDNARLVAENPEEDLETRVNLNYQYQSDPGKCSSSVNMGLGYGYWHDDTQDSEVYTDGTLAGQCELARGLVWQASDSISQVTRDNRRADTEDNRTRRNIFRTGPVYTMQLSRVDQLRFSATYVNTQYEEPEDPDSNRVIGTAVYNHNFSNTLQGGLSTSAERTELDDGEEIDRESASVTFSQAWVTTRVNGAVGINRLTTRVNGQEYSSDGFTGRLNLVRDINPTSQLTFNASRQLTIQTSSFDLQFEGFDFNLTESTAVEATVVSVGYNARLSDGASLSTEASLSRSDYIESDVREERRGLSADYSRPITELLSWFASTSFEQRRFDDEGSTDNRASLSAGLDYQLTARMGVSSAIGHVQKTSDVASREYDENYVIVSLNYLFF